VQRLEVSGEVVPDMVVWEKRNGLISYSVPGKIAERVCLAGEKASLWIEMDAGRRIVPVECHYARITEADCDFATLPRSTGSLRLRNSPANSEVSASLHRSGALISIGDAVPDRLVQESGNVTFLLSGSILAGILIRTGPPCRWESQTRC